MSTTHHDHRLHQNKEVARRFLDCVNTGDFAQLGTMITDNWTLTGGPPNLPRGQAGIAELARHLGQVRQTWRIEHLIAEDDLVAVRATNRCVQESFLGIPGRGIEQVFTATFVLRIIDGRVAATWRNADDLGRLLQLGAHIEVGAA